jgi:hypothetical protein
MNLIFQFFSCIEQLNFKGENLSIARPQRPKRVGGREDGI